MLSWSAIKDLLILGLIGALAFLAFHVVTALLIKKPAVQARLEKETTSAVIETVEAIAQVEAARGVAVEQIDQETKDAIEQILAQPAGGSNRAALNAVCQLRYYKHSAECTTVRPTDTGEPSRTD